jgi:hypothetical protein
MKITLNKVFLQYGRAGEKFSEYNKVHPSDAEKFVRLDSASGGYPCSTTIDDAHDFKTVEAAEKYRGHFPAFKVRHVTVTYEVC